MRRRETYTEKRQKIADAIKKSKDVEEQEINEKNKLIADEKRKNFNDLKAKFNGNNLTAKELNTLSDEKMKEYLERNLKDKYGKEIKFKCVVCASHVLYEDGGYISEGDLRQYQEAIDDKYNKKRMKEALKGI